MKPSFRNEWQYFNHKKKVLFIRFRCIPLFIDIKTRHGYSSIFFLYQFLLLSSLHIIIKTTRHIIPIISINHILTIEDLTQDYIAEECALNIT